MLGMNTAAHFANKQMGVDEEKIQELEDMFRLIKDATGVTDPNEVRPYMCPYMCPYVYAMRHVQTHQGRHRRYRS